MDQTPRRTGPGRQQSQPPELEAIDGASAETAEKQVYRSIRTALMSGLVAPGSSLTSRSLASSLKVSVQPVRDALKRLEADGILESRPQSGFLLKTVSKQEYREIIDIRQRLEGLAARIACERMDARTIAMLERINKRMAKIDESGEVLAENYRFHFAIYKKADRPNLLSIIENLWVRIGPALHHHPYRISSDETVERHNQIIRALKDRDPDAADEAIAEDLGAAAELIIPRLL
jgi:GntR family colanic acid and biofilm gene transcriptional regulator